MIPVARKCLVIPRSFSFTISKLHAKWSVGKCARIQYWPPTPVRAYLLHHLAQIRRTIPNNKHDRGEAAVGFGGEVALDERAGWISIELLDSLSERSGTALCF